MRSTIVLLLLAACGPLGPLPSTLDQPVDQPVDQQAPTSPTPPVDAGQSQSIFLDGGGWVDSYTSPQCGDVIFWKTAPINWTQDAGVHVDVSVSWPSGLYGGIWVSDNGFYPVLDVDGGGNYPPINSFNGYVKPKPGNSLWFFSTFITTPADGGCSLDQVKFSATVSY